MPKQHEGALNLLKLDFQPYDQHSAGAVEGIFARGGVDTAIHTIEDVVYTDGWLYECPFRDIE